MLDGAGDGVGNYEIPYGKRLVEQDDEKIEQVAEDGLRGQGHGHAADAEAGEHGGDVYPQVVQHEQDRGHPDERAQDHLRALYHRVLGLAVQGALRGHLVDPVGEQVLGYGDAPVGEDQQQEQVEGLVEGRRAVEVAGRHVEGHQLVLEPAELLYQAYQQVVQVGFRPLGQGFEAGHADVLYEVQQGQGRAEGHQRVAVGGRRISQHQAGREPVLEGVEIHTLIIKDFPPRGP